MVELKPSCSVRPPSRDDAAVGRSRLDDTARGDQGCTCRGRTSRRSRVPLASRFEHSSSHGGSASHTQFISDSSTSHRQLYVDVAPCIWYRA
jgi:hypothetical protein